MDRRLHKTIPSQQLGCQFAWSPLQPLTLLGLAFAQEQTLLMQQACQDAVLATVLMLATNCQI
jgi:hypothetical protein